MPAYPNLTFTTGASWQKVARGYDQIVEAQIANADLKALAGNLTAGKSTREQKAAAIVAYLNREIRYTGVEFGDAAVVPRPPAETLNRKYGDCKVKAALLVALLRSAGIPSYVALLSVGSSQDVLPDLPGAGMFNHAIVFVPRPPDLWVDATDEYARLGQLPTDDQNRYALIARPETEGLVRIPGSTSADNKII